MEVISRALQGIDLMLILHPQYCSFLIKYMRWLEVPLPAFSMVLSRMASVANGSYCFPFPEFGVPLLDGAASDCVGHNFKTPIMALVQ